jgi:adenine-specific DNA methylase
MDSSRLIEHAFPLKQASLDSVHEKNVRHGHISTLHIWPARRPLAACRAALIATLLPDPGTPEKRRELCEKIGGKVVKKVEKKKMPNGETVERDKEVTEGGILHWGRETENKEDLDWFRQEIRKAYGGRAPKVLDPFAGGGAIPLEAMRLGCDVSAVDINPVAWFILKCTLEYPQKLAGKTHPLPDYILQNEEFMNDFYKAHPHLAGRTKQTKKQKEKFAEDLFLKDKSDSGRAPKADLAWHVRAWGQWVLDQARRELAQFYPTYADFEPLDSKNPKPYEKQSMHLVPVKEDGTPDIDSLNAGFSEEYLKEKRNPRWVAKPTVAYLWARTVSCKNCRAIVPLLKTRWLCKKDKKRVLLSMEPNENKTGITFLIERNVPVKSGNTAQRREHDKRIGAGTMSRSGVRCPFCPAIMTMEDIRLEGLADRLGAHLVAVITDTPEGKGYRPPIVDELAVAGLVESQIDVLFSRLPYGRINELLRPASTRSISCQLYGLDSFGKLFSPRQHIALGHFILAIKAARAAMAGCGDVDDSWSEATLSYLMLAVDRLADYSNALCTWHMSKEQMRNLFGRFALPMTWDFCECSPCGDTTGGFIGAVNWIAMALSSCLAVGAHAARSDVQKATALVLSSVADATYDLVITDPPYYEAISYADLSDVFYVLLRRMSTNNAFDATYTPKEQEIVQHIRADKDRLLEKQKYERMMADAFRAAWRVLRATGRFVIVFAHKHPDAWETLVNAIIQSGFVVDASWPIQTEMANRTRGLTSAALASSVWLVCKKRPESARPGWDTQVLDEMRRKVQDQLREFWDAGIRGPDFVWAATGPALEAYSKHPVVKKANDPGQLMTVSEFLTHVRRMVVDFVVGRVLAGDHGNGDGAVMAETLDEPTAYYLLHRNDFQLEEAPAGACILYAISCGVSDRELADTWELISFTKGKSADEPDAEEADADAEVDPDAEEDAGSKVKLKTWVQRKSQSLGYQAPGGKSVPLIDRVHCLMHLWKAGELSKVDEYLDSNGLRRQELFKRLLQSLIELSPRASEERSILESLSNHLGMRGPLPSQLDLEDEKGRLRSTEVLRQE